MDCFPSARARLSTPMYFTPLLLLAPLPGDLFQPRQLWGAHLAHALFLGGLADSRRVYPFSALQRFGSHLQSFGRAVGPIRAGKWLDIMGRDAPALHRA